MIHTLIYLLVFTYIALIVYIFIGFILNKDINNKIYKVMFNIALLNTLVSIALLLNNIMTILIKYTNITW